MSHFKQSVTAGTSITDGDRSTPGAKALYRSTDLRPRLRGIPRDTSKELDSSSDTFRTNLGLRKVPRQMIALRPDASMIQNARQGVMSKFLRSGVIIRASDLDFMVNPKTAIISLTNSVEMETDHLSVEEEQMPESERTLENLFYICVRGDELPSYHFWRGKDDPDPINVHRPIDWEGGFQSKATTEVEHATPAEYERARKRNHEKPAATLKPKHTSSEINEWTESGKYHRDNIPKRNSQLRSQTSGKGADNARWRPQGALINIPYKSSDQRNVQVSGQFGPQPGDPEWEEVESAWEQRLIERGLKETLQDLERSHPERHRELTYGKKSSMVKPVRGDDDERNQFNQVLKTTVPTVAFKLTQQHFNRPASPLNFQEPLVRGEDPKKWNLQGDEARNFDTSYEIVRHKVGELEFLDFYNERSNGAPILRRRKPIPEQHIHRELNMRSPHLGGRNDENLDTHNLQIDPLALAPNTDTDIINKQKAALERANRIMKQAREEEQLERMKREGQNPPNSSCGGGLTQNKLSNIEVGHSSRLQPISVYKKHDGEMQLPRYESTLDWEVTGGPDMPTVYARVPTLSEIQSLQRRAWHLENQILQREDSCRVCDKGFVYGSSDIEEHYREHRLGLVCPCCQQDWREKSRQDQIAHLALSHQLGAPLAQGGHGRASASKSTNFPLITEIACTFHGCHAPLHGLTAEERSDHAEMHANMSKISRAPEICCFLGCHVNLNTLREREREDHTLMHKTHLPNPVGLSSSQHTTSPSHTSPLSNSIQPGTEQSLPHLESKKLRDSYGRSERDPGQGWYCGICHMNMTTLGITKQEAHARACKTSLKEFLVLTKGEVAQLKGAAKSGAATPAARNAGKAHGKKGAPGTDVYRPEPTNDSSSSESTKKKRKSAAETKTPDLRKRPRIQ